MMNPTVFCKGVRKPKSRGVPGGMPPGGNKSPIVPDRTAASNRDRSPYSCNFLRSAVAFSGSAVWAEAFPIAPAVNPARKAFFTNSRRPFLFALMHPPPRVASSAMAQRLPRHRIRMSPSIERQPRIIYTGPHGHAIRGWARLAGNPLLAKEELSQCKKGRAIRQWRVLEMGKGRMTLIFGPLSRCAALRFSKFIATWRFCRLQDGG